MNKKHVHVTSQDPIDEPNLRTVEIEGKECQTLRDFYEQFITQFGLPANLKRNPGAFTDVLEDYKDYSKKMRDTRVVIKDVEYMFSNEKEQHNLLSDYAEIFERVGKHWEVKVDYDGTPKKSYRLDFFLVFGSLADSKLKEFKDTLS